MIQGGDLLSWLIRIFIPSWRFFGAAGTPLRLEYRRRLEGGAAAEWQRAIHPPANEFSRIVFNPKGNLYLASISIVERFISEIQSRHEAPALHSLVENIVRRTARENSLRPNALQFRISALSRFGQWDEVYTSGWFAEE